jgi:hypothetical protein
MRFMEALMRRKDYWQQGAVPSVTIRHALPEDTEALETLAELDSSRAPRGLVLVADVGGELWAAVSMDDHHIVADPMRPTAEVVWLLLERSRQLRKAARGRFQRFPRVWPRVPDPRTPAFS